MFKKDDEDDDMDDDSVRFTDSSSSDHLPKGTLSQLPTTLAECIADLSLVGEPEIQKFENSGRKVAEF